MRWNFNIQLLLIRKNLKDICIILNNENAYNSFANLFVKHAYLDNNFIIFELYNGLYDQKTTYSIYLTYKILSHYHEIFFWIKNQ